LDVPPRSPPRPWLTALACAACVGASAFVAAGPPGAVAAFLERYGDVPGPRLADAWGAALLTSLFVHVEPVGLAFNLFFLWRLGAAFERAAGRARWLALFLAAGVVTSLAGVVVAGSPGIGISGVDYALLGVLWRGRAREPAFARAAAPGAIALMLLVLVGGIAIQARGGQDIGNPSHVAGLALGLLWRRGRARAR
jgi:membrane associated rhomboid family serine protease